MLTNKAVEKLTLADGKHHADQGGLFIHITDNGAKSWRYSFRFPRSASGKRQTVTFGVFPEVSLAKAREKHAEARRLLDEGINPAQHRREQRDEQSEAAANTFRAVAEKWYSAKSPTRSESWRGNNRRWLDIVYKAMGGRPIKDITPRDVLAVVQAVEGEGKAQSADRLRKTVSAVFDFAAINLYVESGLNPARCLRGAVNLPDARHHPHLEMRELPEFFRVLGETQAEERTKRATRLLFLTFTRVSELLGAKWQEVDLEAGTWTIPGERMKAGNPHIVPLSQQALDEFKALKAAASGEFVFPNRKPGKPMVRETMNRLMERLGYAGRLSPHGVRTMASTFLNEQGFRPDVIERQLAHSERNAVRAAYNRAAYLPERKLAMQAWADAVDGRAVASAEVIQIARAA